MKHLRIVLTSLTAGLLLTGCASIGGTAQIAPRTQISAPGTIADGFCNGQVTSPGPCPPPTDAPPTGSAQGPVVTTTGSRPGQPADAGPAAGGTVSAPGTTQTTKTSTTSDLGSTSDNHGRLHFTVTAMLNSAPVLLPTGSKVHPFVEHEGLTVDLPGAGNVLLQAFGKSNTVLTAGTVLASFLAPGRFYRAHYIHREVRPVSPVLVSYPGSAGTFDLAQLVNRVDTDYDVAGSYVTDRTANSLDLVVVVVSKQHGTIVLVVSGDTDDYTNVQNGLYLSVFGLMASLDHYKVG